MKKLLSLALALILCLGLLPGAMADEPTELVYAFLSTAVTTPSDMLEVQDAINAILIPKYNAKITMMPLSFAEYQQQVTLMLSGNERLDLLLDFSNIVSYSNSANKGFLCDITEEVEAYGQAIVASVGAEYIEASKIGGQLYGVPTAHDLCNGAAITLRKDLLEKYDIDTSTIHSLADLEPVFEIIHANEPDVDCLYVAGTDISDVYLNVMVDPLGDNKLGVLMDLGQELKVENYYASEQYAECVKLMHDWYQKGYIMEDAMTNTTPVATLFQSGKVFAALSGYKPGQESQNNVQFGGGVVELETIQIADAFSFGPTGVMMVVPTGTCDKALAVQVMNEFYENAELINLINYGIEGKHYVLDENGQVTFPEGVDASNSGYYWSQNWSFFNEFIGYTRDTDPITLWADTIQFNEDAIKSKAMGFVFDGSGVKNEITACSNVVSEYAAGLESGQLDPEVYLPEFIAKLEASGINTIVEAKQTQLDAWAQAQGIQ